MFTTARLILRAYEPSDDDNILKMWNDETLQRGTRIEHVIALGPSFKDTVHNWVTSALTFVVITVAATGEFVGTCSLWTENGPKNRDAHLGITIAKPYWDKGYGTETLTWVRDHAFKDLALHRISLGVFEGNKRAVKTYQKIGFIEEGRLRKANWSDGHWEDIILMSMLDEDWSALQDKALQTV